MNCKYNDETFIFKSERVFQDKQSLTNKTKYGARV